MSRIRIVEIKNFRAINELRFVPTEGVNCFIGPGDSGKSSILDAIDLCLGARRTAPFCDTDFHNLNVDHPIEISLTLGELDDSLKNIEQYGQYLRGYDKTSGELKDEPESGFETVLTLKLEVGSDLEPAWLLYSERAAAQGLSRGIQWADRVKLAPTRIGALAQHNLGWQRGSVLNRISDERADASATLAKAAREARAAFGDKAATQLGDALKVVGETAKELGIPIGDNVKALLDAHSVSFVGGTISLHDAGGVPLRGLGIGSTRLLIAGLQRKASDKSSIILVDELEHGLEPHRIIRLLGSLGAKDKHQPLQVFATTHSPIALRELSGSQLIVVRRDKAGIRLLDVGTSDAIQGTIRTSPDAFLAGSVLICEGASEVGIVRGIDQYRATTGGTSIFAAGVGLVDAGGEKKIYARAPAFVALGYRCSVLRDDDVAADATLEGEFTAAGGRVFKWKPGQALEQAIFNGVSEAAIRSLVAKAVAELGNDLVDAHIKQSSKSQFKLTSCDGAISEDLRQCLGLASKSKSAPWFKSVTKMEEIGYDIIGPDLPNCREDFVSVISAMFEGQIMSNPEIDLLSIQRGTVTAPAGCGKTHLIATALGRHDQAKPILVLTHTNAGVAALRARLDKAGVSPKRYRIVTIDGWSMRLASTFPRRSDCPAGILQLNNPSRDYPAIRDAAIALLCGDHISDLIAATYSRLIIDEYQDCSRSQHAIVMAIAEMLPVCALGDPLQAIFGFGGDELPDWDSDVCRSLPLHAELKNPWRWANAGAHEFGEWLLSIRGNLLSGAPIDLRTAPKNVSWIELDGKDDHTKRLSTINAMRRNREHKVIAIADSRNKQGQQRFASQIPGASTVEAVDLKDLTDFAASFNPAAKGAFHAVITFAGKVMTEINYDDLVARLRSIAAKTNRLEPTEVELACFRMVEKQDYRSCADLLVALNRQAGTQIYRPAVFRACLKALQMCAEDTNVTFNNAAIQMREQNRLIGRPLPSVAVGSTLLVKGLEAECAVVLETERMNANNLYVAMTRGAISLAVCSRSPFVNA